MYVEFKNTKTEKIICFTRFFCSSKFPLHGHRRRYLLCPFCICSCESTAKSGKYNSLSVDAKKPMVEKCFVILWTFHWFLVLSSRLYSSCAFDAVNYKKYERVRLESREVYFIEQQECRGNIRFSSFTHESSFNKVFP